eukprot:s133_g3.t1
MRDSFSLCWTLVSLPGENWIFHACIVMSAAIPRIGSAQQALHTSFAAGDVKKDSGSQSEELQHTPSVLE